MTSSVRRLGRRIKLIFRPLVVSAGVIEGPVPGCGESKVIDSQHRHIHATYNRLQYADTRCDIARQTRIVSSLQYNVTVRVVCLGGSEGPIYFVRVNDLTT